MDDILNIYGFIFYFLLNIIYGYFFVIWFNDMKVHKIIQLYMQELGFESWILHIYILNFKVDICY
jgi:hypothetical protein